MLCSEFKKMLSHRKVPMDYRQSTMDFSYTTTNS
jgi:hypothetical protein